MLPFGVRAVAVDAEPVGRRDAERRGEIAVADSSDSQSSPKFSPARPCTHKVAHVRSGADSERRADIA